VYITDTADARKPINSDTVRALVAYDDRLGVPDRPLYRLLRNPTPALPLRDSLFVDPVDNEVLLMVGNVHLDMAVAGVFSGNVERVVMGSVNAGHIFGFSLGDNVHQVAAYLYNAEKVCVKDRALPPQVTVMLPTRSWELVTFAPVRQLAVAGVGVLDVALLGLVDKYNGLCAVKEPLCAASKVADAGLGSRSRSVELCFALSALGKVGLYLKPSTGLSVTSVSVTMNQQRLASWVAQYSPSKGLLTLNLEPAYVEARTSSHAANPPAEDAALDDWVMLPATLQAKAQLSLPAKAGETRAVEVEAYRCLVTLDLEF